MVLEGVLADGKDELFTPLRITAGVDVKDDVDDALDVDGDGLA